MDWLNTPVMGEVAPAPILAAIITGVVTILISGRNKKLAMRNLEVQHAHDISQLEQNHKHDLNKLREEGKVKGHFELVSMLENHETLANATSRSIQTMYAEAATGVSLSPASFKEKVENVQDNLDKMQSSADKITSKSATMGTAATEVLGAFNYYKTSGITNLDAINAAIKHREAIGTFHDKVVAYKQESID